MSSRAFISIATQCRHAVLSAALLASLCGCHRTATITFAQVPAAASGGAGARSLLSGQVKGPHQAHSVILYAFSGGRWWVQPLASSPFTTIKDDGTWSAQVHLGSKYAAILTRDETLPPSWRKDLPEIGKGVEAVSAVNGREVASPVSAPTGKTIRFSGYDWRVRAVPGDYSSRTSPYSPENVFLDDSGALHLRMTRKAGDFVCAELHSVRAFGYGTYRLSIRDLGQLEPSAMFSAFTRVDAPADNDAREMDIHVTRLGNASNKSAEFVVQPYFVPQNSYRFEMPSGPVSLELQWFNEWAKFSAVSTATRLPASTWRFTTGVPLADDGLVFLNLCAYGYARTPPQHDAEVVVNHFDFLP